MDLAEMGWGLAEWGWDEWSEWGRWNQWQSKGSG